MYNQRGINMAKKNDIFSSINSAVRTGRSIIRTGQKIEKALSPDYEYNILTGRYVKKKSPAAAKQQKQSPTKPAEPSKTTTEALNETSSAPPTNPSENPADPTGILSQEWVDENTFLQHGEGFETTVKINKESMTAHVVFVSGFGFFADVQVFKEYFEGLVEGALGSMQDYTISQITAIAVFDMYAKDMWTATWNPDAEITYTRR